MISIIEFVHESSYDIRKIDNVNDFEELISGVKNIPCIYVDISEMEDNGYRVLEDITNTDNLIIKNMPIAIICKEEVWSRYVLQQAMIVLKTYYLHQLSHNSSNAVSQLTGVR